MSEPTGISRIDYLERTVEQLDREKDRLVELNYRYENTLAWISYLALQHYLGEAFEPEHMRDLANIAADAMDHKRPEQPDYDEVTGKARERGREWAARLSQLIANDDAFPDQVPESP